jgi:hypothetical protein
LVYVIPQLLGADRRRSAWQLHGARPPDPVGFLADWLARQT